MQNFLTNFMNQGSALWAKMGAGARVTLVSFIGVTVLLIGALGFWSSQPDYVMLYGGLTAEDAAAISTKLGDDKIPFKYEASRGTILVPAGKAESARLNLAGLGLPKSSNEGFEIFDKSTFGMTEFVQRINYQRALQGTLARNIQAIDAVESARVSLSIPEEELFTKDKKEAKASIVIHLHANRLLSGEQVGAIRYLVSSSVPKLDPRNVTIVDSTGKMLSRPQEEGSAAALSDEQLTMQKQIEKHFTEKVQGLLDPVLGSGQSVVRVTAQLNLDRIERSSEKMDPDSGVLLEESSHNEETAGKSGGPAGVPGVASNTANGNGAAVTDSNVTSNMQKRKTVSNKYHYNTVSERVVLPVGSIRRLSVAVLVAPRVKPAAAGNANGGGEVKPAPRTPQELSALTEIVRSAVGFSADRQDTIKIEEIAFSGESSEAKAAPAVAPAWPEMLSNHIGDILAFAGIAIMALILYRMFSRVTLPPTAPHGSGSPYSRTTQLPPEKSQSIVMQEEVKQLVTANSAQAVNIIRSMMK
jgi:flagellar M-ring protein FliF